MQRQVDALVADQEKLFSISESNGQGRAAATLREGIDARLRRLGHRGVERLLGDLRAERPGHRRAAAWCLARFKSHEQVNRALWALRADPAVEVRCAVLDLLCRPRQAQAAARATWFLADPERAVRDYALATLMRHDEAGRAALRSRLSSLRPACRLAMIERLWNMRDSTRSRGELTRWLAVFAADDLPKVRRLAAETMADLRDPAALTALAGLLSDPDPDVRHTSAEALGYVIGRRYPSNDRGVSLAKAWWHSNAEGP